MLKGAVAARYAGALYDIALENKMVDQLEEELQAVVRILDENAPMKKILFHPRITAAQKQEVLAELFGGRISEVALNFLNMLVNRQREMFLADIIAYFTGLANQGRNISDVTVTSAVELTDEEKKNLAAAMAKYTGKQVRLSYNIDRQLLGGVVVRFGDKVIDGSVTARLNTLREHLKQIS
ncbi:MAG: ATP synthase F1 subunit delta [Firmicutes bacterium]|nr:ATP synthase F1 subunit delta [Bacillota bacterium]